MKGVLGAVLSITVLCSVAAFGQEAGGAAMAACGPKGDHVKVNPDTGRDPSAQPEPGKALVYVIEDDGVMNNILGAGITLRAGLDGAWVGAVNHHNPFLVFSVTPGERHLCVNWQSGIESRSRATGLAHIEAQPNRVYYFRVRQWDTRSAVYIDFDPIDSDMGTFLLASLSAKSTILSGDGPSRHENGLIVTEGRYATCQARRRWLTAASRFARTFALPDSSAPGICVDGWNAARRPYLVSLERAKYCDGQSAEGAQAKGTGEEPKGVAHDR